MPQYVSLLALARRLPLGPPPEPVMRVAVVIIFIAVGVYYALARDQSFTLHAQTRAATVTLTGPQVQEWFLRDAILCLRRSEPAAANVESDVCSGRFYTQVTAEEASVLWPERAALTLSGGNQDMLLVAIDLSQTAEPAQFNGQPVRDESLLMFPKSSLVDTGSLVARGRVSLGALAAGGAPHLLVGGSYEIREELGLSTSSVVVATGNFLPGDMVRIEDAQGLQVTSHVLIAPSTHALAGFDVVATTPPAPSVLKIQRIGAEPSRITSRWTDRLINDAFPLALSIFLGLLGASLGITKSFSRSSKSGER